MRSRLFGVVAGLACVMMTTGLARAETYSAISPKQMLSVLESVPGSVYLDSQGDTTVEGNVDGTDYQVYFYDCDGAGLLATAYPDSTCLGVEYRAYFYGFPKDDATINAFNDQHHYGHLWRDGDGDLGLQMNVVVEGGVTDDNLRAVFARFRAAIQDFNTFMAGR